MEKILITGSSGFVGRRCVDYALANNLSYKSLGRSINSSKNIKFDFMYDCFDGLDLREFSTIIHLVGLTHEVNSKNISSKSDYYKINVRATEKLALKSIESNVKNFIYLSSVKSSGVPLKGILHDENYEGKTDGIYGATKREAEQKLLELNKSNDFGLRIIRPPLVYGKNVKGNLLSMLKLLELGLFPPLPDAKNARSMIHVDDLVKAIFFLLNQHSSKGQIYNVTDSNKYSSRLIYEALCLSLGKKPLKFAFSLFIFHFAKIIFPSFSSQFQKLFTDASYSDSKIRNLGFETVLSLTNFNEKLF